MTTEETMQQRIAPMFPGLMGVRITHCSPDRVTAELPVRPELCTAGGILHGGACMAFADTLGAVGTVLNLQEGQHTTTTDSSTKFIAGARVDTTRLPTARLRRSTHRRRARGHHGDGRSCRPAPRPYHPRVADQHPQR